MPDVYARDRIRRRYELISCAIAGALRQIGVDVRVGPVPGEYCPGAYSISAGGCAKVAGISQRVVARAAHVGGVIVVDGSDRVREALRPVNAALGIEWDPSTVGSVCDEVGPVPWDAVAEALLVHLSIQLDLRPGVIDARLLRRALELGREAGGHGAIPA